MSSRKKYLLERTLDVLRQHAERVPADVLEGFNYRLTSTLVEKSQKYLWTESAWLMSQAIAQSVEASQSPELWIGANNYWIEFSPHSHAFERIGAVAALLLCRLTDVDAIRETGRRLVAPGKHHQQQLAALDAAITRAAARVGHREEFKLTAIAADGEPICSCAWAVESGQLSNWSLAPGQICPDGACRPGNLDEGDDVELCAGCLKALRRVLIWLSVASQMLAGWYRETPPPNPGAQQQSPNEVITRHLEREERDPIQTWKRRTVKTTQRFEVVRFDASLKPRSAPASERGSWIAGRSVVEASDAAGDVLELDPKSIVYMPIQPKVYARTYRHARYKNVLGMTVTSSPKAHPRPVTLATFLRKQRAPGQITEVRAVRYEQEEQS